MMRRDGTMRRTTTAILALTLLVPTLARAGAERVGTTAANFLSVGAGTQVLGMGGTTLGLAGDLNAAAWNTGALGWLSETQLAFSHAMLTEETAQEWLALGGRFGASNTRWSLSGLYQTEGKFEGRDASNNPTDNFDVASFALGAHLAHNFGERVTVGLGAKWVNENLGPVSGSGIAMDAGMLMRFGLVGIGVSAQNVLGSVRFEAADYPMPANYGIGIGIEHPRSGLRLGVDANFPDAYYTDVRGGVEWRWKDHVALRTGYRAELGAPSDDALGGPTFGFGAGAGNLWLDYGYLIANHGEAHHRIGFSFNPGRIPWSTPDPFGQGQMPQEFDAPSNKATSKSDAKSKSAADAGKPGAKKADGALAKSVTDGKERSKTAAKKKAAAKASTKDDAKAKKKNGDKKEE